MTEERAVRARRRSQRTAEEPLDPEQAEALSRAAREAVRQPADPRLEKSFAHLGLVPDVEPQAPPKRTRTRRSPPALPTDGASTPATGPAPVAAPSAAPAVDLEPLLEAVTTAQRATDDIRRRLDVLTWMLAGVIGLIGLMAVVLILRGPA